jgi:hypothetical protein
MEIHDQLAAKELIRHRCRAALKGPSEDADAALMEAFHNAMLPRIQQLVAKRKKELKFPTPVPAIEQFKAANKKKKMLHKNPREGSNQ